MMKRLFWDEEGQGFVEYSLIILLVALVVIGALSLVGSDLTAFFTEVSAKF